MEFAFCNSSVFHKGTIMKNHEFSHKSCVFKSGWVGTLVHSGLVLGGWSSLINRKGFHNEKRNNSISLNKHWFK